MAETLIAPQRESITFKAPRQMNGPAVHRFKREVIDSFGEEPRLVLIDLGEVEFIDVHGLVLFRDLCEIVRTFGARVRLCRLSRQMRELLAEVELLPRRETVQAECCG